MASLPLPPCSILDLLLPSFLARAASSYSGITIKTLPSHTSFKSCSKSHYHTAAMASFFHNLR
eukprot:c4788_g1_i1 orf=179-367(+)